MTDDISTSGSAADPSQARFHARSTVLVPLAPEHTAGLRNLELSEELAFRWRHGGAHPSPDQYAASVWMDVLCNFLVFDSSSGAGDPVGLVSAYQPDHANGHCRVAAARFIPSATAGRHVLRGAMLLLDHLFRGWPFRKVYFEVPEYNLPQFSSGIGSLLTEEARLDDYLYLDGRYWSMCFLAITREHWASERQRVKSFMFGNADT